MNLNDSFYLGVCFFGHNGFGKSQPVFQDRNKQIAQCSCIAYYVPGITDSCKESTKNIFNPITNWNNGPQTQIMPQSSWCLRKNSDLENKNLSHNSRLIIVVMQM